MKKIVQYFLQGVLLVGPLAIIVYVIYAIFVSLDGWLNSNIEPIIGYRIPGLGVLVLFATLTLLGLIGQTAIIRPIKYFFRTLIEKVPLLNLFYTSLNDLFSAFVGKEKKFNTPVKVLFNKENDLWKLGFITRESLEEIGNSTHAAVYFPHSYNFSGELYMVPVDRVITIDISPAAAMKFIVSGGVTRF
ncbi:DUF502 domain-containing protein [uncultured Draconibacterium sp.]|uniref:DUF502 domain-containing protein n=1 Tax=uncultured Draconibacterium sp. TaxID=1573823 RepID=UPI0032176357